MTLLGEGDLDRLGVGAHGATTAGTGHLDVVTAATTVAGTAVEEVVVGAFLAGLGIGVFALEDARVHVGCALGALGADLASLHVDVAGYIEGTEVAKRGLPPGVVQTTELGKEGVGVDGSAGCGDLGGERQGNALTAL